MQSEWIIYVIFLACFSPHALISCYSRGRCRPAGCWWASVYRKRRSASSTGLLWPESPGDSGPCPVWLGQPYRRPATTSCGTRIWRAGDTSSDRSLFTLFNENNLLGIQHVNKESRPTNKASWWRKYIQSECVDMNIRIFIIIFSIYAV